MINTGLEVLLNTMPSFLQNKRLACLVHAASFTSDFTFTIDALLAKGLNIQLIFSPEHGLWGTKQYMEGSEHGHYAGIPVFSLYNGQEAGLRPSLAVLENIDVILVDLQDVGARYYTFATTMLFMLEAAAAANVPIWVCDRPNPIGLSAIEGGGIEPHYLNFCGPYNIPQRHGFSIGELAQFYNIAYTPVAKNSPGIGAELTVVPCSGLNRNWLFPELALPWIMPSPQMPSWQTALLYPGMCLLEGTNISEGRGTTLPFALCGAPFIQEKHFKAALDALQIPGVAWRVCQFIPKHDKYSNTVCHGVQLHITDPERFLSLYTGLAVLYVIQRLYPEYLQFRHDVYEFRSDVPAVDLLLGGPSPREKICAGEDLQSIYEAVLNTGDLTAFWSIREKALLYDEPKPR
jgi:uncharacterized protein YbbC (DUF1343 family)